MNRNSLLGVLFPKRGNGRECSPILFGKDVLYFGRSQKCDIRIYEEGVRRMHCILSCNENNEATLESLNTSAVTYVNGRKFDGRVLLSNDDVICISSNKFRFLYYDTYSNNKAIHSQGSTYLVLKEHKQENVIPVRKNHFKGIPLYQKAIKPLLDVDFLSQELLINKKLFHSFLRRYFGNNYRNLRFFSPSMENKESPFDFKQVINEQLMLPASIKDSETSAPPECAGRDQHIQDAIQSISTGDDILGMSSQSMESKESPFDFKEVINEQTMLPESKSDTSINDSETSALPESAESDQHIQDAIQSTSICDNILEMPSQSTENKESLSDFKEVINEQTMLPESKSDTSINDLETSSSPEGAGSDQHIQDAICDNISEMSSQSEKEPQNSRSMEASASFCLKEFYPSEEDGSADLNSDYNQIDTQDDLSIKQNKMSAKKTPKKQCKAKRLKNKVDVENIDLENTNAAEVCVVKETKCSKKGRKPKEKKGVVDENNLEMSNEKDMKETKCCKKERKPKGKKGVLDENNSEMSNEKDLTCEGFKNEVLQKPKQGERCKVLQELQGSPFKRITRSVAKNLTALDIDYSKM